MRVKLAVVIPGAVMSLLFTLNQGAANTTTDPTRPYLYDNMQAIQNVTAEENPVWHLSGIKINQGKKTAILNGQLIREGDMLGMTRIMEIRPTEVILLHEQQQIAIKLLIQSIKTPVSRE
jgi:hypothetical protein